MNMHGFWVVTDDIIYSFLNSLQAFDFELKYIEVEYYFHND